MTKINLLPPERVKARRAPAERSYLWLVIALPAAVLVIMGVWFFMLGGQLNNKNKALEEAKAELADKQAKTASLQQYKARKDEISKIEQTVVSALQGRVFWARILNNVAIMCPNNIWLTSLEGSSAGGTGTVNFEGYALQCPNRMMGGFYPGVLDFHPDYRPIAGWIERMGQIDEFALVWLSSADPQLLGATAAETTSTAPGVYSTIGSWTIKFSSTATLDMDKATVGGTPAPAGAAAPAPAPAPSGGEAQ